MRSDLALLCAAVLAAGLSAQAGGHAGEHAGEAGKVVCRFCDSSGQRACKRHGKLLELERSVVHCSVAAACKTCGGALGTDCKICVNPVAEAALIERRKQSQAWLAARRKLVDEVTGGKGILHAQSAHVDLAFSIRPLTVGKRKLDTHRLMHLYLQRIEALRARFIQVFGLAEKDFSSRLQIFMFRDRLDHERLAPRVAGGSGGTSIKLMGADAVYCMYQDRRTQPGDKELYRSVVHNVTHLLLSNMKPERWLGHRKQGWIDAGVAHWFEDLLTEKCANYCYEEVGVQPGTYKGGRWRVPVRKLVESGRLEPFTKVASLNTDQLSWPEHAQAFAYVDFLITSRGGHAFAALVRAIKQGVATRDALRKTCGLGMLQFDASFKEWVRATYPLQER